MLARDVSARVRCGQRRRAPGRPPGQAEPADVGAIHARPRPRRSRQSRQALTPGAIGVLRRAIARRGRLTRPRRSGSGASCIPTPSRRHPGRRAAPFPTAAGCGQGDANRSSRPSPESHPRHAAWRVACRTCAAISKWGSRLPERPGQPSGASRPELLPIARQQVQALAKVLAHLFDRRRPAARQRIEHERRANMHERTVISPLELPERWRRGRLADRRQACFP